VALLAALTAGSVSVAMPAAAAPAATPTASPSATAPKPVGTALTVTILGTAVLTLPAKDGLRDSTRIRIRSGASGTVDLLAVSGTRVVHLGDALALKRATTGWSRTVTAAVATLPAGSWSIRARRTTAHTVRAHAAAPLLVGTGTPVHVFVRPAVRKLYPYRDGVLDSVTTTVQVTDETGTALPFTGTLRIDAAAKHRTKTLSRSGTAELAVTGLPLGGAVLTANVTAPAGATKRTTAIRLAPTAAGTAKITRSSDTVQPVVDGLLDSVTMTTTGAAVATSPAPVSGALTLTLGTTVVKRWKVTDGAAHPYTWNGRTAGAIVPGTYTATLSLRGPEGVARTTAKRVYVKKDHLPYRVQDLFTVAAGNQQGLAVHAGIFYVGFANSDGTARIDRYTSKGARMGSFGPLKIGHVAELSYSTTTEMLYAANGGGDSATTVWALDPATGAVKDTLDLSTLGNNGMVAVDDAGGRLLVFSGRSGAYTVTAASLATTPAAVDENGTPTGPPTHTMSTPVPITISGVPQGIEVVGKQLWVYTSLKNRNHIARYDLSNETLLAGDDLMNVGEGEGMAYASDVSGPDYGAGTAGWMYVGAHTTNRVGVLRPVADE
jgi:hypothetical protein